MNWTVETAGFAGGDRLDRWAVSRVSEGRGVRGRDLRGDGADVPAAARGGDAAGGQGVL